MDTKKIISPAVIEPKLMKADLVFDWNHEQVKNYLVAVTEKYHGLVVTDENEEDMSKALREVVSLRTAITKFQTKAKHKLKEPVNTLELQVKDLLKVVSEVENPLRNQLDVYEEHRQAVLSEQIADEITNKAKAAGLRQTYLEQFVGDNRWYNKTSKYSETTIGIDREISRLMELQRTDDDRKKLLEERLEMSKEWVALANEKYRLNTPMKLSDVISESSLSERTITELKQLIYRKAQTLHEIEQQAIERAEQKRIAQEQELQRRLEAEQETINQKEPVIQNNDSQIEKERTVIEELPSSNFKDVIVTFHDVNMITGEYEELINSLDHIMKWKFDTELK